MKNNIRKIGALENPNGFLDLNLPLVAAFAAGTVYCALKDSNALEACLFGCTLFFAYFNVKK